MATPDPTTSYTPAPRPRRPFLRTWRGRFAIAGSIIVLLLVVAWFMARATPAWYRPLDAFDVAVQDAAEHVRLNTSSKFNQAISPRFAGDQTLVISDYDIDAFLAVSFRPNLNNGIETPTPVPGSPASLPVYDPFVQFSEGKVTLGIRSPRLPSNDARGGVLTISLAVNTTAEDAVSVRVEGVWVGNLRVPKFLVEDRLRAMTPSLVHAVRQAMRIENGANSDSEDRVRTMVESFIRGEPVVIAGNYQHQHFTVKSVHAEDGKLTIIFAKPPATARATSQTTSQTRGAR